MKATEPSPAARSRVLLVEDDDQVAYVMQHALGMTYEVIRVATVGSAKATLRNQTFDVIVLDWRLGAERGNAILDALPKSDGIAHPPTIVTSGDTSEDEARRHGATEVLHKPFQLEELRMTISRLLRTT